MAAAGTLNAGEHPTLLRAEGKVVGGSEPLLKVSCLPSYSFSHLFRTTPFIKCFCARSQVIDETLDVKEMIFNAERVGGLVDEPVRRWLLSPGISEFLKLAFGSCRLLTWGLVPGPRSGGSGRV